MVEGDLTDQASCPRSSGSDPQTVISDTVVLSGTVKGKAAAHLSPHSPTSRHNPFNEDSDTNTSANITPVHVAGHHHVTAAGDEMEISGNQLEVIRYCSFRHKGSRSAFDWSTANSVLFQDGQAKETSKKAPCEGVHRFQQECL